MIPDYKAFAHEIIDGDSWCDDWDGGRIQDLAVKFGIIREVKYDPDKHRLDADADPGGQWFEFADEA